MTSLPSTRGRPRDQRVDRDVLAATRALLVEVGYAPLTIDAIARRADVSRPAIYRRWRSKAQLVHDAIYLGDGDDDVHLGETGDFGEDLRAFVASTLEVFLRPEVQAAVPGLLADQHDDPGLRERMAVQLEAVARADFAGLCQRAAARGDVRPDLDADVLFDAVIGATLYRVAAVPGPVDADAYARALADLLGHAAAPADTTT